MEVNSQKKMMIFTIFWFLSMVWCYVAKSKTNVCLLYIGRIYNETRKNTYKKYTVISLSMEFTWHWVLGDYVELHS